MRLLNSVTVLKNVKGGPFVFLVIQCVAKYRNKRLLDVFWISTKEDSFGGIQKLQKSRILPKKIRVKNNKVGILCFRGSGRRCFCFGRGSGVSSMFWTSVVQVDDVEQMNKKVD